MSADYVLGARSKVCFLLANRKCAHFEILDICKEDQFINGVMQKCRLSYAKATEYLSYLNDFGSLKRNETSFKSSSEGLILLEEFKKLFDKLDSFSGA